MPDRVIYILQDAGRPDLVKIGKDSYWPIRYRQARCQSPRDVTCLALWRFPQVDSVELGRIEKSASAGLERRDLGNNTTEWFVASAVEAVAHVEARIGRRPEESHATTRKRSWDGVEPWDAWRDEARFVSTRERRRLWVGAEIDDGGAVGTLKTVHSPYFDGFFQFSPTYAPARFRWLTWWQAQDPVPSERSNRLIYDYWHRLVAKYGQGPNDMAVGWLRKADGSPAIGWPELQMVVSEIGLLRGDPKMPKPRDARASDPQMGGKKPIRIGDVPPQHLVWAVAKPD